jgi:hypothetical protein
VPNGYASHADYMARVAEAANARTEAIDKALRHALRGAIRRQPCDYIDFGTMSVQDLANAFLERPEILKPLFVACNVAGRAVARDLNLRVNTYRPRLTSEMAMQLAKYIKPYLPATVPVEGVVLIDKTEYIDKEIRKGKGAWEREVCEALNEVSKVAFKKRRFAAGGEIFELDAASPPKGSIRYAVDVKRVEGSLDIQKRSDEIINKADKFKSEEPKGKFAAVVYYPLSEPERFRRRLASKNIDIVSFASESEESIEDAAREVAAKFGILKDEIGR